MEVVFSQALMLFIVFTLAASAAYICEKAGIVNIAVEGIMVIAMFAHVMVFTANVNDTGNSIIILSLIVSIITAMAVTLLFGLFVTFMKTDHVVAGTIVNVIAPGITFMLLLSRRGTTQLPVLLNGGTFFMNVHTFVWVILIVSALLVAGLYMFMHRTKWGIRIKASGDNPQALDSSGINVIKVRLIALAISGIFTGIAAVVMSPFIVTSFTGSARGYGFLAIAILVLSQWKLKMIPIFAFAFALFIALLGDFVALRVESVPKEIIQMIPYLLPLIVLAIMKDSGNAPKSAGQIYDKSKR